mgnify:FL=1|jgi:hypothetical protein
MSNVVSIFGEFVNPNAKEYEKLINDEVKGSLDHFMLLMQHLIYVKKRSLRKKQNINVKIVTTDYVVIHMSYIDLIESMFDEYVMDYGKTKYIRYKKAYFYSRIMPFFEESLKDYKHLIDMDLCLKKFNSC